MVFYGVFWEMPVKLLEEFAPEVCFQIFAEWWDGGLNHTIFLLRLRFLFRSGS